MATKQVCFDASGARARWTTRAFLLGYLALCAAFSATVIELPRQTPLALSMERPRLRPTAPRSATRAVVTAGPTVPRTPVSGGPVRPLRVGFHAPWDENSGASLAQHIDQLDWLIPASISVTGPRHDVRVAVEVRPDAALAQARPDRAVPDGAVVQAALGEHPAVRLVSLPNGGKATALNQGVGLARGEVLIALDTDTLFEPETIARLAQRLIYRQLLYWVTIRTVMAALRGPPVRWGKPKRSGRVALRKRGLLERWRRRLAIWCEARRGSLYGRDERRPSRFRKRR